MAQAAVPDTWVCPASGPSLTREQVDYCRGKAHVLAVNDNYRLAPWADSLYAFDRASGDCRFADMAAPGVPLSRGEIARECAYVRA